MNDLKNCPFCGAPAALVGQEIRDWYNVTWAPGTRKEYWVQPHCHPSCIYGNTHSRAFGIIGGIRYTTPEAATEAWNRRSE